ncbi:MAG: hypothetical protein ACE5F9_13850 [Phycisphaerae bacterium]
MSHLTAQLRRWGVPIASTGAMMVAAGFALSRQSRAAADLHTLHAAGTTLDVIASQVTQSILSPSEAKALNDSRADLEARLHNCRKQNLVVGAISECTRKVGALVREIKPVATTGNVPRFRVTADGTYRQLAEFMGTCAEGRLPVRVVEFSITRSESNPIGTEPLLRGDITVESFVPAEQNQAAEAET